jgi:hypothetical protein
MIKETQKDLIPKSTEELLQAHEKNIKTFIRGQRVGAAQQFGYAYLAGRELLLARDTLPNGNSGTGKEGQRNAGIMRWADSRFSVAYRTLSRWMEFAQAVNESVAANTIFKKRPLLLTNGKLTVKDRSTILEVVPEVMDGKSMTRFMRDTQILRDPLKAKHHPRNAKKSKADLLLEKQKQAERFWARLISDHKLGKDLLRHLSPATLNQALDSFVDTTTTIRTLLKSSTAKQ